MRIQSINRSINSRQILSTDSIDRFSLTDSIHHAGNPVRGHKEVPSSTGHMVVTTRYSADQQGFKSRQKIMRLYKQWHRPISKRFIIPSYSISRTTSIDSDCCRLPTTSVVSNNADKLRSSHENQSIKNQSINRTIQSTFFVCRKQERTLRVCNT